MGITKSAATPPALGDRVHAAASHLYDAECALHVARQSKVDPWIAAAYEKLHEAIAEHLAALANEQIAAA